MKRVLHLLGSLEVGGMQRGTLALIRHARGLGLDHRLLLFDEPFANPTVHYDPGDIPTVFIRRRGGIDLRFVRSVAKYVKSENVDVLHGHNDSALVYSALVKQWLRSPYRPGVLAGLHTLPSHRTLGARVAARWASRCVDRVVVVSRELGERLHRMGWIGDFEIVTNGVDLTQFFPGPGDKGLRTHFNIPADALLVGHVGRFDPVKRQAELLAAATRLASHVPSVHFVFAGQGPDLPRFLAASAEEANIHHIPRVMCMSEFLRGLDMIVLCSTHEATPRVLMEAMACGVPVIASDVGGIPELLRTDQGPAGILIQSELAGLDDAISWLVRDQGARQRFAHRGLQRIQDLRCEEEWDRYFEIYRKITPHAERKGRFSHSVGGSARASSIDS